MNIVELEKEEIKNRILTYYSEGHITGNALLYKEVLHPDWRFYILDSGKIKIVDRSEYMTWYDPKKADPSLNWETEFYYIDVFEYLASVKLRLECEKVRYIDYINMMKINSIWWIVHKMSFPVEKENY